MLLSELLWCSMCLSLRCDVVAKVFEVVNVVAKMFGLADSLLICGC